MKGNCKLQPNPCLARREEVCLVLGAVTGPFPAGYFLDVEEEREVGIQTALWNTETCSYKLRTTWSGTPWDTPSLPGTVHHPLEQSVTLWDSLPLPGTPCHSLGQCTSSCTQQCAVYPWPFWVSPVPWTWISTKGSRVSKVTSSLELIEKWWLEQYF